MKVDHLDRRPRFSRRRPSIRRKSALAVAALLLVAAAPAPAPNGGVGRAAGAQTTAKAGAPSRLDDGLIDGQSEFKPEVISCNALKPKHPSRQAAELIDTPDDLRRDLHYHILSDVRDFDDARMVEKNFFYALTGFGIILGAIAAFFIAVDFHLYKKDGESAPRPWRKWVVVGLQSAATMVVGAVATFKLTDMWQTRVDGLYQLRNLDSELVAGGCTTDAFDRIVKQVNLIEAKELDLKGIFSSSSSQNAPDDQPRTSEAPPQTSDQTAASGQVDATG